MSAQQQYGQPVREWHNVDPGKFRNEIRPLNQPAILRGLVADWPIVAQGRTSPEAVGAYLRGFDQGRTIALMWAAAAAGGHFFYRDDMRGLNFERRKSGIGAAIDELLAHQHDAAAPAMFVESMPIPEYLPQLLPQVRLPLLNNVVPRIWIGNSIVVQTHFDLSSNFACVAAGRRRFTLFPPEQLPNLYVGPFDFTLSGPPVSMVPLRNPDFQRFPRFRDALAAAQVAELLPGDALYIPYAWWHNVESLERFNVLVNYWWNDATVTASPFDSLLHGVLALRDLPPEQRAVWRGLFDHYVFKVNGEPMAHLAPEHRGLLGTLTSESVQRIRAALRNAFSR
ncbi:MAG TPA: cupin-like domain-containing protein [Povalibacter sp.]|nr:cupin-like domain-containing protein [Povalibacter sp.]